MSNKLVYGINDRPKFSKMLVFALQQLLAILAATIAVPTIIKMPTQIPAAIFGAGIGTLVYQLFTRFKSPVFLGSSFAFLNSLCVAVAYGYFGILLGSVVAGAVYVVIAIIIKFVGTGWVSKLMPPIIIGPTVMLIGLSLADEAMGDLVKAPSSQSFGSYNLVAILCGLITFFTVIICSTQKKFTMPKMIPFIIGIGAGYAVASIFTAIGNACDVDYLKIINWEPLYSNFFDADGSFRGIEAFISVPKFALVEGVRELATGEISPEIAEAAEKLGIEGGASVITWGGVAEVIIAFLPVALVVFAEHIADHKNLSTIIDKDLIEDPGLEKTLLGDGVGSMAGAAFGVCPNTTYGESVGCVAITGNASVATITTTAFMCIILSFISPITTLLQTIPNCVMGGVCLTLYGFIAISGLKMFKSVDLENHKNLFVVSSILISGIGGLSILIPYSAELNKDGGFAKVIEITSIATALIIGIITNLILSRVEKIGAKEKAPEAIEEKEETENYETV